MEKDLYNQYGDIVIETAGQGFRVAPESTAGDSPCGGCSGC